MDKRIALPVALAAGAAIAFGVTRLRQSKGQHASTTPVVIDGKATSAKVREEIKQFTEELKAEHGIIPGLGVILVGERKDSQSYVRNKKKSAAEVGFHTVDVTLPDTASQEDGSAQRGFCVTLVVAWTGRRCDASNKTLAPPEARPGKDTSSQLTRLIRLMFMPCPTCQLVGANWGVQLGTKTSVTKRRQVAHCHTQRRSSPRCTSSMRIPWCMASWFNFRCHRTLTRLTLSHRSGALASCARRACIESEFCCVLPKLHMT